MFVKKVQRKKHIVLALLACSVALSLFLSTSPVLTQSNQRLCTCDFADPKWEAYGTKAACAAFMHKGRTSCEVEFGGLSANPNLVSKLLGFDPAKYRARTFELLNRYFQDIDKSNIADLTNPEFLRTILPVVMRGAYLRGQIGDTSVEQIKLLDDAIAQFFEKNANEVSSVFLGTLSHFSTEVGGARFDVGKGYVVVDHPIGHLVTIYLPTE